MSPPKSSLVFNTTASSAYQRYAAEQKNRTSGTRAPAKSLEGNGNMADPRPYGAVRRAPPAPLVAKQFQPGRVPAPSHLPVVSPTNTTQQALSSLAVSPDTAAGIESEESKTPQSRALDIDKNTTSPKLNKEPTAEYVALDIEPEVPRFEYRTIPKAQKPDANEIQDKDERGRVSPETVVPDKIPEQKMSAGCKKNESADRVSGEYSSLEEVKEGMSGRTKALAVVAVAAVGAAAVATGLAVYFSKREGENNSIDTLTAPTTAMPTYTTAITTTTTAKQTQPPPILVPFLPPELMPEPTPQATQSWQNEPIVVPLPGGETTPPTTAMQGGQNESAFVPLSGTDPAPRITPKPHPSGAQTQATPAVPFESPEASETATPEPTEHPWR
jgi:hypothetical protein